MQSKAVTTAKEFGYSTANFEAVRTRLKRIAGINLADSKDSLVYSRLSRRIRHLSLSSFDDYLRYLDSHSAEHEEFVNALTTNLTSFFREKHHFDALKSFLQSRAKPIKIWCAASSTGEEPYSIAMTVVEAFSTFSPPVSIIASDIDSNVLNTAQNGIYPLASVENLSSDIKRRFFHRGKGNQSGKVKVVKELSKLIEFRKLNLMDSKFNLPTDIDVIFCRNVMIYFDKSTQLQILEKMLRYLKSDGLYIAGHSENFNHVSNLLMPLGKTIYKPRQH